MKKKIHNIPKIALILLCGLLTAGITAMLVNLENSNKDGIIPWFALLATFITNAGLHINLWLRGYKKVNLDKYTYTSIIFAIGFLLFIYLSPLYITLLLVNFSWFLWIFIYLMIIKKFYTIEKTVLATVICSLGVLLSYYTTIGYDYFNVVIISFFFSSSITILYPLLIPTRTVPSA